MSIKTYTDVGGGNKMEMVPNSNGGRSFAVDMWVRLDRFLILGTEEGSYYASEQKLTEENLTALKECVDTDGVRTVKRIVEISQSGRAVKNNPAIYALAYCLKRGNDQTRKLASEEVTKVCRIGTHLFDFCSAVQALGGWGRATKRAVANWYVNRSDMGLANQLTKYQRRNGWSHRDVLRLAHPKAAHKTQNELLNWAVNGWPSVGELPHENEALVRVWAMERLRVLQREGDTSKISQMISDYKLPRECVPTELLNDPNVWESLLPHMGLEAMIRNLGKMSAVGLVRPLSDASQVIINKLSDVEAIKAEKLHPLKILVANRIYGNGKAEKGSLRWNTDPTVLGALDNSFYAAFEAVEPSNKKHMLALDVSASMTWSKIAGMPLTPREASAAMACVTLGVEPQTLVTAFSSGGADPRMTRDWWRSSNNSDGIAPISSMRHGIPLNIATDAIGRMTASGTDCALPMIYATKQKIEVDTFVIYTDSETSSTIDPVDALREYRQKMGRPAKLIVVGMISNGFSIADPNDSGMLDCVGFDTAAPALMANFARE